MKFKPEKFSIPGSKNIDRMLLSKKNVEQKQYMEKIEEFTAQLFSEAIKREFNILDMKNVCSAIQQRIEMAVDKTLLTDLITNPEESKQEDKEENKNPIGFTK